MVSLEEIIEMLNTRLNHKFEVIYKNGDVIHLRGYELKRALLTGQISLNELKDIVDETDLENFHKRIQLAPKLTRKDLLKIIGVKEGKSRHWTEMNDLNSSMNDSNSSTDSEFSTFLKLLAGLVILVIILKSIARR